MQTWPTFVSMATEVPKLTNFGAYLKKQNIAAETAAKQLGVTKSYVHMLMRGDVTPALKLAGSIEKWTKGKVKMQMWLEWM